MAEFKHKSVWENKFRTPTVAELREVYPKPVQGLWDDCREVLSGLGEVREDLAWLGLPWRWSLVYRGGGDSTAMCYLVPQPNKPLIASPLTPDVYSRLSARKLSRFVRDGLVNAPAVGAVRWCQWELTARGQLDEVVALIKLRQQSLLVPAGE